MKPVLLALSVCCAALIGCAVPPIESSPPPPAVEGQVASRPTVVRPGDSIELRFVRALVPQDSPYLIGVGDVLRIDVFNHETLSQPQSLVLADGQISLPLVGRLLARGKTLEALESEVAARYRMQKFRDPQVNVAVVEGSARAAAFLDSIFQAGGQGGVRLAVEMDATIAPPAVAPITANRPLGEIRRDLQAAYTQAFGPGLSVMVRLLPAEDRRAYVIGEVRNPGAVVLDAAINPLMAVARAGGFLSTADLERVRVYRFAFGQGVDQWEVDLASSLLRGSHPRDPLQIRPDDVIFVPKTGVAMANDAVEQYILKLLPLPVGLGLSYELRSNSSD